MMTQGTIDQRRNNKMTVIVRLGYQANCLHQMKEHKKSVFTCALNRIGNKSDGTQNFVTLFLKNYCT
jgi:hypothetical protein